MHVINHVVEEKRNESDDAMMKIYCEVRENLQT